MTTREEVEAAEAKYDASKSIRYDAESVRRGYVSKRRGELEAILAGELHDMNRQVNIALAAEREARTRFEALTIELARSGEGLKYPVGTSMVEWEKPRGYLRDQPWKPNGVLGITEVWTHESEYPGNVRWSLPNIGEEVVRVLKKDGTKSRRFTKLDTWYHYWYPVGVDPNNKAKDEQNS